MIVKDKVAAAMCDFASVTCRVKVVVPLVLGIPEITPEDAFSVRPAGRRPALTDHVYADVPPAAGIVAL